LYDSEGLKILTEQECQDLLGQAPLGRIVFTDRALPAIQPVNFVMAAGEVVILTAAGSKLAAAARNAVVAFEIDQFDQKLATGWSVVVIGHAREITEPSELEEMHTLPLTSWTPGEPSHYIAISPVLLSGRRLPKTNGQAQREPTRTKQA
jgi:nitroimidazol reductase NimA-like FMN-containing flavoprotein (pyridoxamine 5'-phosphate oxidase superfamily)